MKSFLLKFFKKYWLCMLLSIIMVIGIALADHYDHLFTRDGYPGFKFAYMFLGMPLLSQIIGGISYIKAKNIWLPPLIVGIISFVYWVWFDRQALNWFGAYAFVVRSMVYTLIGRAIALLIHTIIKAMKEEEALEKEREAQEG